MGLWPVPRETVLRDLRDSAVESWSGQELTRLPQSRFGIPLWPLPQDGEEGLGSPPRTLAVVVTPLPLLSDLLLYRGTEQAQLS